MEDKRTRWRIKNNMENKKKQDEGWKNKMEDRRTRWRIKKQDEGWKNKMENRKTRLRIKKNKMEDNKTR